MERCRALVIIILLDELCQRCVVMHISCVLSACETRSHGSCHGPSGAISHLSWYCVSDARAYASLRLHLNVATNPPLARLSLRHCIKSKTNSQDDSDTVRSATACSCRSCPSAIGCTRMGPWCCLPASPARRGSGAWSGSHEALTANLHRATRPFRQQMPIMNKHTQDLQS